MTRYLDRLELDQPGGVPRLDTSGLIPDARIASTIARDSEVTAAVAAEAADPQAMGVYFNFDPRLINGTFVTIGTANRCHFFRIPWAATISKIALNVVTSSGNISLSVHGNTGSGRSAMPGSRRITTGSIACPTGGGVTDVSLGGSVAVIRGEWLAIACDNTTATFGGVGGGLGDMSKGIVAYQDTAFPAPSTPAATTGAANRTIALIGVP